MELQSEVNIINEVPVETPQGIYSLNDIVTKRDSYDKYTKDINAYIKKNKPVSLKDILSFVEMICPDLKLLHDLTYFKGKPLNKGIFGQVIEQALFGNKPNCISEADLYTLGIELKIIPMKELKKTTKYPYGRMNMKERTKLSHAGCEKTPETFNNILIADRFEDTKCYKKSKNISYIGFHSPNKKWKSLEDLLKNKILFITTISLGTLPDNLKNEMEEDFTKIQKSLREKNYTQRGQNSIHCHRCGSKGADGNRALGFTPKFTLKMITQVLGIAIECKGRSSWIRADSL